MFWFCFGIQSAVGHAFVWQMKSLEVCVPCWLCQNPDCFSSSLSGPLLSDLVKYCFWPAAVKRSFSGRHYIYAKCNSPFPVLLKNKDPEGKNIKQDVYFEIQTSTGAVWSVSSHAFLFLNVSWILKQGLKSNSSLFVNNNEERRWIQNTFLSGKFAHVWYEKSKQKDFMCRNIHRNSSLKYCFLQILLFWILRQIVVDKLKRNSNYVQITGILLEHKNSCDLHLLNPLRISSFLKAKYCSFPTWCKNVTLVGRSLQVCSHWHNFCFFLSAALAVQNVLHWIALTYSTRSKMGS